MNLIDVKESAVMALDTVRANKLRSSLTILGVSVGVITVIFMVGIIQGLNKAFAAQIETLGSEHHLGNQVRSQHRPSTNLGRNSPERAHHRRCRRHPA
jgi:ABC-type lipoprotein release transport system permease subunit